jgi:phage terminase Nu1 subunit (DNA packaging protein)
MNSKEHVLAYKSNQKVKKYPVRFVIVENLTNERALEVREALAKIPKLSQRRLRALWKQHVLAAGECVFQNLNSDSRSQA